MLNSFIAMIFRFLRWWLEELASLLPPSWLLALRNRKRRLLVTVTDADAQLLYGRGENFQNLGSLPIQDEATKDFVTREHGSLTPYLSRCDEVILRLPPSGILRRQVELPLAALENLREVIAIEMDRHTPFSADEVYFDYHLLQKDRANQRLLVNLVVATRSFTDSVLHRLRGWNIQPDRIDFDGAKADKEPRFNLLPSSRERARRWKTQWLNVASVSAICVLLTVSVYLPLHQKKDYLERLETELLVAKREAAKTKALEEKIEKFLKRSQFVVRQKLQHPTVAELLTELTITVPDDTWIIQLSWAGDRLTLAGYSASTSSLIALLEELEMLSEVRFNSPVTVDQRIGLERFNLSAKVLKKKVS